MKLYLFKRASDGAWIFGESTDHEHPAGTCRIAPSTDKSKVSIIYFQKSEANQNKFDIPVTSFYDESDTAYADFAALKAGYNGFFFSVAGSGSGISFVTTSDGQYLPYMTDPNDSTKKTRVGVRSGNLVLDITLTATGFDGNESTDGGITGDWVNVTGS